MTLINLGKPIRSDKVRSGFQPHWRTVFIYRCPECSKEVRVFANSFRGKTPVPGVGAITCPHCPLELCEQIRQAEQGRKLTYSQATSRYVHRFTMQHVPYWAEKQRSDGTYYAPQYRSDLEWYRSTVFPGEPGYLGMDGDCYSSNQTWPLGQALQAPYRKGQ